MSPTYKTESETKLFICKDLATHNGCLNAELLQEAVKKDLELDSLGRFTPHIEQIGGHMPNKKFHPFWKGLKAALFVLVCGLRPMTTA